VAAVQKQAAKSDKAVQRLKRAARRDQTASAKRQLRIARSRAESASRLARRMANRARNAKAASNAGVGLTIAGIQYDKLLEALTALVSDGTAQREIARAIKPTVAGKTRVLRSMTGLIDEMPRSTRPLAATVVAGLGAGDATEVENLDDALTGGLPGSINAIVTQALALVSEAIETAMRLVRGIVPQLPAEVQPLIGGILGQVTGIVGTLVPSVLSTVTGLINSILGSLPFVGAGSSQGGGLFGGLLGSIFGGSSSSSDASSATGGIFAMIQNLLGSIFAAAGSGDAAPSAGFIAGIISSITELINSLLGGLLGGASGGAASAT